MTLLVPRYSLPSSVVVYLQAGKGAEASGMKHDLRTNHQRQRAEICLNFLIEGLWELNLNNLLIQDTSRPSSILTFNFSSICEHLFFHIIKSNNLHIQYFFMGFQNITKIRNFLIKLILILSIHKHFLGSCEVPHKIWAQSVQLFWRLQLLDMIKSYLGA